MIRIDILKEAARVSKKDSVVVVVARSEMSKTQNFYVDELVKTLNNAVNDRIFTERQLREDFSEVKFSKVEIFDQNGLMFGLGWV